MTDDPRSAERSGRASEVSPARQTVNDMISAGLLDDLMDRVDAGGLALTGDGGVAGVGQGGPRAGSDGGADRASGLRERRPGIWVQATEGAKFWAGVCAELRNRGIRDTLIVCCDGLTGFPEAIEATWPQSTVQTCTVHLIRAAMRFVSYQDRRKVAAALKPIYTAPTAEVAQTELLAFTESALGRKYPATVATWTAAWERFIPFLAFPPELRKIIYTTNAIESLNYQLRKVIKNRGHFPSDDAAIKLLWLAIRNIEDKRARDRAKRKGLPAGQRRAAPRLVEGATVPGWKQALGLSPCTTPTHRPLPQLTIHKIIYTKILTGSTLKVVPAEVVTDAAPVYPAVLDELVPAAWHHVEQYANNPIEADHGQLKRRLRPMRGLQTDRTAQVVIAGHAFVQNLRRGTTNSPSTYNLHCG